MQILTQKLAKPEGPVPTFYKVGGRTSYKMLKVRLQRIGKRGQAYFRIVVLEHTTKPKGEYLELLGSYNPHQKEFKAKKDRIEYWLSKGAQLSPTVNNLLVNYKVMDRPKVQSWKPKKKEAQPATVTQ